MPLTVNIRHLENDNLDLDGKLSIEDVGVDGLDDLIHARQPVRYSLAVQKMDNSILVQGWLKLVLECECVRCLRTITVPLELDPWVCHLPLEGEDAVAINNDCVDLTPYIREDILLRFPQHPLCEPECDGLLKTLSDKVNEPAGDRDDESDSSDWSELDKLKF